MEDVVWTIEPGWQHLAPLFQSMANTSPGESTIVKQGSTRTVRRVHGDGLDVHVKLCQVKGIRAWLRDAFRSAKACLEFRKLREAARRDVAAIDAIAFGVGPRCSYLVTKTVPNARPLHDFLEGHVVFTARERQRLAVALGEFMARVHHGGVTHPDLHPGNILISTQGEAIELRLVDVHNAQFGNPVGRRASLANLTLLNRWFLLRSNRSDRLRFWRAYILKRTTLAGRAIVARNDARMVEAAAWTSNYALWRSRLNRCLTTNTRFTRTESRSSFAFQVRQSFPIGLDALANNPKEILDSKLRRVLKDSRSSTVAEVCVGDEELILKRFKIRGLRDRVAWTLAKPPAVRAWRMGHAFLECLLPTARPLALVQCKSAGVMGEAYLITEKIPHACNLSQALNETGGRRPDLVRKRSEALARIIRRLHQCGWSHRDLKASNILLSSPPGSPEKLVLIDLVGVSRPWRLSDRRRQRDLARLNASFQSSKDLSRTQRLRFLLAYLETGLHGRTGWKDWWRAIARYTSAKVAQNMRRGRPLT